MKTSDTLTEIIKAIINFQAQMPTLGKGAQGYGYSYTPLDDVVEAIRPLLSECGLAFVQFPSTADGLGVALTSRLLHKSGEWMEDTMVIPLPAVGKANEAQAYGAGLTYARRYALTSMLGIVADEDSDGSIQNDAPRKTPKPRQAQPENGVSDSQRKPTENMIKKLYAVGHNVYGDEWDEKRAALIESVTHGRSNRTDHLTFDECKKLIDGIEAKVKS